MKNFRPRHWKKFWIAAASAAVFVTGEKLVQACGASVDPTDYYPSFFDNTLPADKAYRDFRYSSFSGLIYDDGWDVPVDSLADTADANRAEWAGYTGGLSLSDVDSFVYKYPRTALAALYDDVEKGQSASLLPDVAANKMTAWFRQSRDLEALGYLMFAKQCEPFLGGSDDPWEVPKRDSVRMLRLAKNGLQLHAAAKNKFIKDRYTFQVLRLNLYANQPERTLKLYDSLNASAAVGEMANRLLGLQAGAFYKQKKYDAAAYRYSLLFDRSDEWKRSAWISYDWSRGYSEAPKILRLCQTPHERAVVHLMTAMHEYEQALPEMEKAYAEDPAVSGLDAVFTREINKIEERWLQNEILSRRKIPSIYGWMNYYQEGAYDASSKDLEASRNRYAAYRQQLAAFGRKVADGGKASRPAYWNIAVAYLATLQDDIAESNSRLATARKSALLPRERDQVEIISLLNVSKSDKTITAATEAEMIPGIKWLDGRAATDARLDKTYRDFWSSYITAAYLSQRDTVKAIFALARAQRRWDDQGMAYSTDPDFGDDAGTLLQAASPAQFEAVKAFVSRGGSSVYDKLLIRNNPYPLALLYELEGTRLLREHDFAGAAQIFQKAGGKEASRVRLPNPFVLHLQETVEADAEDTTRWYTKLDFARRMAELQTKTDAASLFAFGQGLYAMTYYGKAHHAFDYYRSSVDEAGYYADSSRRSMPPSYRDYYEATSAEQAFVKAAAAATDPELKAKALFLAARCWQKRAPIPAGLKYSFERDETKSYYQYSLRNPYFKRMKTEVPGTRWYAEAESSCEYLADYAKRR